MACCFASLSFSMFMDPGDLRIVKIVIFARAVIQGLKVIGEKTGLFKPIETNEERRFTVESALGVAASTFVGYCFIFELNTMSPSLQQ